MLLLGINGYAGSGKSELADHLIAEHGFKRVKFATPFKAALRGMWLSMGISNEEIDRMEDGDLKDLPHPMLGGTTPRDWQIHYGEGTRERFGQNVWVDIAVRTILNMKDAGVDRIVVDDVRKEIEGSAVQAIGGYVASIHRTGVGPKNGHATENMFSTPDWDISNDGTIADLHADGAELINLIKFNQHERGKAA